MEERWKCRKCAEYLVPKLVVFDYMDLTFSETLPCCPKCGYVLISQALAEGKMVEVEALLEDK